jgi:hypothetical protein
VAGSVAPIGLLAATLWTTGWSLHDPAMISAFRYSLSPAGYPGYGTHFRTIADYVVSDNTDGLGVAAVLWLPLMGLVLGAVGAALAGVGPAVDPVPHEAATQAPPGRDRR